MIDTIASYRNKAQSFIKKYANFIFVGFAGLLLGISIYLLTNVVSTTLQEDVGPMSPAIPSLDQKTIDEIKKLQISDDQAGNTITLPSPRSNPLVE